MTVFEGPPFAAPKLRLDLIIRTSKRKAEAKSPQQQRDIADACALAHGHEIVFVHDSGTDESGKTMNRATLAAAEERHRAGLTDGIIVALADRLGRAPIEEAMTVVRQWCTEGNLVLADMGGVPIDLTNGVNETNVVMQLQFARQYWLTTATRMLHSQRDAIKAGKWIGKPPIGYEKVGAGERKGCLAEHEHYGPIIAEAYRVAAIDGHTAAVACLLRLVPERAWDTSEVRRVLACKAYLGEVHYGSYEPNLNAHAPLVDRDTWLAAQTDAKDRRANVSYLLSKVVQCAECGEGLTGQMQAVRGVRYRRYRCSNIKTCKGGSSIAADALESHVRARVAALMGERRVRVRFEVAGLQEARDALAGAKAGRDAFADDLDRQEALGDEAANRTATAHRRRVEQAQARYEQVAKLAIRNRELPAAEKVEHDDETLLRALRLLATHDVIPVVRRGRRGGRAHAKVSDRVSFKGLDDRAGELTA